MESAESGEGKAKLKNYYKQCEDDEDDELKADLNSVNIERLRIRANEHAASRVYHAELMDSFKMDCEKFLLKFTIKESCSYRVFAEIWRSTDFEQILEGEANEEYLLTFLENCFFQLKKYVIFASNFYTKVGAFYMIYSIYFKQPKSGLIKLRCTHSEYRAFLHLLAEAKNYTYELHFIFNKLRESGAILCVTETRRVGIESRYAYEETKLVNDIFGNELNVEMVEAKLSCEGFYGVSTLQQVQDEYKEGIKKYLEARPDIKTMCNFQPISLAEKIAQSFAVFQVKPIKKEKQEPDDATIYTKRQGIKNKAFTQENTWFLDPRNMKFE